MAFQDFVRDSGLKVLAMVRLSQCDYSVILYLLNCAASGLDELITTEQELGSLIGFSEREIHSSLMELRERCMVNLHFSENNYHSDRQSFRIGLEYDMDRWNLKFDREVTMPDAIVFPFRRGSAGFQVFEGSKKDNGQENHGIAITKATPTWKRILDTYCQFTALDDDELKRAERDAQILVDTHPVDQVLLMVRHFGGRIPTLSLLASAWQHYQSVYEEETEKVDFSEARQKHLELDNRLREAVDTLLEKAQELNLNEEETTVLEILSKHRHPRRQLFWAYQSRSRYPNLQQFFHDNSHQMLPVTSSGNVWKKRPHQD